jgi:hypothetical protein
MRWWRLRLTGWVSDWEARRPVTDAEGRLHLSTCIVSGLTVRLSSQHAGEAFQGCGTTTSHGRLMLTVLGGLAGFESDLIRARTGESCEHAKARGVKMGRPRRRRRTRSRRPYSAATLANRCATSPDRKMSVTARFRG